MQSGPVRQQSSRHLDRSIGHGRSLAVAAVLALAVVASLAPRPACAAPPKPGATHAQEAMQLGRRALEYFMQKEFRTAAEMYRRAAQIDPGTVDYMYGVARSEREDGRVAEALAAFEEVVARTAPDHALNVKSKYALAELRAAAAKPTGAAPIPAPPTKAPEAPRPAEAAKPPEAPRPAEPAKVAEATKPPEAARPAEAIKPVESAKTVEPVKPADPGKPPEPPKAPAAAKPKPPAPVVPEAKPAPPPPPPPVDAAPAWQRPAAYAALGVGGVGLIVGGVFIASALGAKGELNAKKLPDGRYDVTQISVDDANAELKRINTKWALAGVSTVVGLAAGGVGAWLLLSTPDAKVALAPWPTGTGMLMTARF